MTNENFEICKRIAEEIERICQGNCYKCPKCDEVIVWNDDNYNDEEYTYTCDECGKTFDESDLIPYSIGDYFADNALDVEYRINSSFEYKAVRLMIAFGGPTIYVDTYSGCVELYHWGKEAKFKLDWYATNDIDKYFEDEFKAAKMAKI